MRQQETWASLWQLSNEKAMARLAVFAAACSGALFAYSLYGGLIDPRQVDWLIYENDPLQHYLGWHYFRRDEWQWPLGALTNLASDIGTSIVFTDSVPLIAIPLKLLHGILPDPFQYLGLVMLANLMLNAAVACALLLRCGLNPFVALLGALLFVSLPMATMRGPGAHGHEALSAHWLLLWASFRVLFWPRLQGRSILGWAVLLAVAVMMHFYLFFMVGVLWAGWLARAGWLERAWQWPRMALVWVGTAVLTPALILLVMWGVGYFHYGAGGGGGGGYGVFSAELLTYFNPRSDAWFLQDEGRQSLSAVLPGWLTPVWGQYEGQAYAGIGALLLLLLGGSVALDRGWQHVTMRLPGGMPWLMLMMLGLFIFSLSDRVVIGYRLFELGFGDWLWPLPEILRSSGRLAWPFLYGLLLFALLVLCREWSTRRLTILLSVLVLIQWLDLKGWHASVHDRLTARLEQVRSEPMPYAVLEDEEMQALWGSKSRILALPVEDVAVLRPYTWLAAEHEMSINIAHLARITFETMESATALERERLAQGNLSADAVYVLTERAWAQRICILEGVECREFEPVTLAWQQEHIRNRHD